MLGILLDFKTEEADSDEDFQSNDDINLVKKEVTYFYFT